MKNNFKLISLLLIMLVVGCNNQEKNIQKAAPKNKRKYATKNSVIQYTSSKIKYDKLTFSFKFYYDKTGCLLNKIEVCTNENIYQTIPIHIAIEDRKIYFKDWNFDGYKDISIIINQGSGGTNYCIWNYNPKVKKFIFNKDLSDVLGLEMDSISKYIIFHYRAGWQEELWDTLIYKKSKLVFIKGMRQQQWNNEKGNQWRKRTFNRIINHRFVTKVDSCIIKQ